MSPNSNLLPSGNSARHHTVRKRKYQSDDNDFSDDENGFSPNSGSPSVDDDRRAHHNELERRRRDHIKDHFLALKNTIPLLEGEKSSRALILKRAVDYITLLQSELKNTKLELEDQKRMNDQLRHHATLGLIKQSVQVPMPAPVPTPAAPVFPLSSSNSAFMSLPSTSSAYPVVSQPASSAMQLPQLSALDGVTLKPASPMCNAATGATSIAPSLPGLDPNDRAKTALISSLLQQLLQQSTQPHATHTHTVAPVPVSDFAMGAFMHQLQEQQVATAQL